jgi:hypothetical protein
MSSHFWSDHLGDDPKRAYRWILQVGSIPAYVLKKCSKPSFAVTETPHKFINHTYYYPGRVEWNTVTMTLADPVQPDMASTISNIIWNSGYHPAQTFPRLGHVELETMSKRKSVNSLGQELQIVQIDDMGHAIETWKLINPWVKDVKFGELDYESDDLTNVELEVRYDWASLETHFDAHLGGQQGTHYGARAKKLWTLGDGDGSSAYNVERTVRGGQSGQGG